MGYYKRTKQITWTELLCGTPASRASARRHQRERERQAERRRRELAKQQKELAKMEELERAKYEVEVYENRTGNLEEKMVLSVAIPRDIFEKLNFETLDPSDSMSNFVYRMKFKKTQGFSAIERIKLSDLKSST